MKPKLSMSTAGTIFYHFDKNALVVDGAVVDSPERREFVRRAAEEHLGVPVSAAEVDEALDIFETIPEHDADLSRAHRSEVWKILDRMSESDAPDA